MKMEYEAVIGLEVHVQLNTKTNLNLLRHCSNNSILYLGSLHQFILPRSSLHLFLTQIYIKIIVLSNLPKPEKLPTFLASYQYLELKLLTFDTELLT